MMCHIIIQFYIHGLMTSRIFGPFFCTSRREVCTSTVSLFFSPSVCDTKILFVCTYRADLDMKYHFSWQENRLAFCFRSIKWGEGGLKNEFISVLDQNRKLI